MDILEYSEERLSVFLDEIEILIDSDFPYPHSREALIRIREKFGNHLSAIKTLTDKSDPATISAATNSALLAISSYLTLLGFLLRSTNVRNAFEVYGPLLRLSRQLLGTETKLILSSEWDYSPLTYFQVPTLQDFVFIGLPAPESSNPLLIPLAGHELGHSIWVKRDIEGALLYPIAKHILDEIEDRWDEFANLFPGYTKSSLTSDIFARQTWSPSVDWAMSQIKETFCDFIGLKIFGSAYLYAFAYLLAPNLSSQRNILYPNMRRRIADLCGAANAYNIQIPEPYIDLFKDDSHASDDEKIAFQLSLADSSASSMVKDVIDRAGIIVDSSSIPKWSEEKIESIYKRFITQPIPAEKSESLSNILNAGWKAYILPDLWKGNIVYKPQKLILKEILLKSIEVLEYEQILGD